MQAFVICLLRARLRDRLLTPAEERERRVRREGFRSEGKREARGAYCKKSCHRWSPVRRVEQSSFERYKRVPFWSVPSPQGCRLQYFTAQPECLQVT
jgi:hypothetical protein